MKIVTIYEDQNYNLEETVKEVAKAINKGYTRGKDPTFKIENE